MAKRRIYTLNGIPPEVIAVAFAKCSRSPEDFDKIAAELNADKSRQFHEKWVVGYGHSSVAEHAVLSIAIENVSMLATKVLEDNRLASYTEKSTRYQVFDKDRYYKPKKIMDSKFGPLYEKTINFILEVYQKLFPKMVEFLKGKYPDAKEIEIKNKALDNLRYLLPVAVQTNLGMTVNARNLEYGIVKLMSHPLEEMHDIGKEIKEAVSKVTPTLIKYTKPSEYLVETVASMPALSDNERGTDGAVLVEYDVDAVNKIVSSLLYRFSQTSYDSIRKHVEEMPDDEKDSIIDEALKRLGKFDKPLREFENAVYTFDVLMDYGAFRDVQRHRMCTQTNQDFTVDYGYDVPSEVVEAGMDNEFRLCMETAKEAHNALKPELPAEAAYIIPMAYKKRVLMTMNLRELFHFIKLRSTQHGHISYRRIAWDMYDSIAKVHPIFAKYIEVTKD